MTLTFPASRAVTSGQLNAIGQALSTTTGMYDDTQGAVTVNANMVLNVASIAAGVAVVASAANAAAYAGATTTVGTSDPANPRVDLVVFIPASSTVAVRAGTAVAAAATTGPVPPAPLAGDLPLAVVYVGAGVTAIVSGNITDQRTKLVSAAAYTRVASQNAALSTTSTVSAALYSSPTLAITVNQGIRIRGNYRKQALSANTVALGLTINGTIIYTAGATMANALAGGTATQEAEDGIFECAIFPRSSANYLNGIARWSETKVSATGVRATGQRTDQGDLANPLPNATITSIVITAINNVASNAVEVFNVTIDTMPV